MPFDSGGLEVLDDEECHALLSTEPLGRIVYTDQALPAIQPVNFLMHDGDVIIKTAEGSKLGAAARHAVVAFEIDRFDPAQRTGWSVVLVGQAQLVSDPGELDLLDQLPLSPWAPGPRDRYIRITPHIVTGRRIPPKN